MLTVFISSFPTNGGDNRENEYIQTTIFTKSKPKRHPAAIKSNKYKRESIFISFEKLTEIYLILKRSYQYMKFLTKSKLR